MKNAPKAPRSVIQATVSARLKSGFGMVKVAGKDVPADFDVATMPAVRKVTLPSARGTARRLKPIDL